jgi:hypothetical protein
MRVLFLDFDGVLHPAGGEPGTVLPFEWLPLLEQLLAPWPDVRLAVHSTWRYLYKSEEFPELLGPLGSRFIGAAPRGPRAESVLWFLQLNPVIDDYLVLDDAPGEFPSDFPGNLVLCEPLTGISAPEVQSRIKAWLAGSASMNAPRGQGAPLLYLDFDGCLHHESVHWEPGREWPSLRAPVRYTLFQHAALLDEMLAPYPSIAIVLSTTWVWHYGLRKAAKELPAGLRSRVIGATYDSEASADFAYAPRGEQVTADVLRRKPSRWLALDDNTEGWPAWALPNFVRTHPYDGISPKRIQAQIRRGLAILAGP